MGRLVDEDDVIDIINFECGKWTGLSKTIEKEIKALPSTQPERIQNNAVHLCDSCQYTYVTCPSHGNDAVFGDGKGNDNICACNKYRPISAQQERPKGYMKIKVISAVDGEGLFCKNCDAYCLSPLYNFCPKCGVGFIGVRGEQDEQGNHIQRRCTSDY